MARRKKEIIKDSKFLLGLTDEIRQEIKMRAALRHVTMTRWITQAIMERINRDRRYEKEQNVRDA